MSKWMKRAIWAAWYVVMCWVMYQLLGWLGILFLVGAGVLGGIAIIFINRKVRKDGQIEQFRKDRDHLDAPGEGLHPDS